MKKQSGRQGKTSTSRPLEGGGKRAGVKELRDVARALRKGSTDTEDDKVRDEWLRGEGYRVLRFWDNEVFRNIEGVLEAIRDAFVTPHPPPLPQETVSQSRRRGVIPAKAGIQLQFY